MNYFVLAILTVIGAMCIFVILDRICNCIEYCVYCKAYGKYIEKTGNTDISNFKTNYKNPYTKTQEK